MKKTVKISSMILLAVLIYTFRKPIAILTFGGISGLTDNAWIDQACYDALAYFTADDEIFFREPIGIRKN